MICDKNGPMLSGAREAKFRPHPALQVLLFLLVMIVGQMAGGMISGIAVVPVIIRDFLPLAMAGDMEGCMTALTGLITDPPDYLMVTALFATACTTAAAILYCRFIERRSTASMGLAKAGAVRDYLLGWPAGGVMFSEAALVCVGTGTLRLTYQGGSLLMLALYFLGYMVQGMSEEVLVRGCLMTSLTARAPVWLAVLLSSLLFAAMHLLNPGITLLAFVNLTLFGVFAALLTLRHQRLWGVCAMHSAWNFVQGNVFGISVSGTGKSVSVFTGEPAGTELLSGGAFGLEGGLAVTAVFVLGCLAAAFIPEKGAGPDAG